MSTGGKIVATIVCLIVIYTTYPIALNALRGGAPRSAQPAPAAAATPSKVTFAPPGPQDMGPWPKAYVWQERMVHSKDFGDFAAQALPDATAGNADAQFALYGVFSYCRDGLKKRTPEQLAAFSKEMLSEMHRLCDRLALAHPELAAEAQRWLASSLAARFPRALAFSALEELDRVGFGDVGKREQERVTAEARADLLLALQSNDPAITTMVPEFLTALFPNEPRVERAIWVWLLAACEQGLDCAPGSDFVRRHCDVRNNCVAGESGPKYIRRASGDFPSLTSRARDLARLLRNSKLDDAAFDQTVMSLKAPRT